MSRNCRFASPLVLLAAALLLVAVTPARADLVSVNIFDNTVYDQTSSSAPTTPTGYFFNEGGTYKNSGDFDSATATGPGRAGVIREVPERRAAMFKEEFGIPIGHWYLRSA